jgi:hypothetical protein
MRIRRGRTLNAERPTPNVERRGGGDPLLSLVPFCEQPCRPEEKAFVALVGEMCPAFCFDELGH